MSQEKPQLSELCLNMREERELSTESHRKLNGLLQDPLKYTGQILASELQRILDYNFEVESLKAEIERLNMSVMHQQAAIIDILDSIGLPAEVKIDVRQGPNSYDFWYDKGNVSYSLPYSH